MSKVVVLLKPVAEPLNLAKMRDLTAYRVIKVKEEKEGKENQAEVGDIVIKFPGTTYSNHVFNCTKGKMFIDQGRRDESRWQYDYEIERAFDIESIVFCTDKEDRPSA